jgi:tight adherence protein C
MIFGITPIVILISLGVAFSIGAIVYSLVPVKSELARRLERVEAIEDVKNRSEVFARIFNEEARGALRRRLEQAGWYNTTPAQMSIQMFACGLLALAAGIGVVVGMNFPPMAYFGVVLAVALGAYLPFSRLSRAIKARKTAIQRALPDFLDMLASTVAAGLAFNAALSYAQDVATGPLGDEINAALSEVRLGRSRADALRAMALRVNQEQLTTFVTSVIQSERLGANMAVILKELAEEVRNYRMTRAEELANMMPTKMALPMALFMLPALFLMIFGGVIAEFFTHPQ